MRRWVRQEGWLLVAIQLLWLGAAAIRAEDTSYWLISKDLLDHAKLTLIWQNTLPVKKGEKFEMMTLLDKRLYMRTDRNYTWAIDTNDGKIVFSRSIAPAHFPILGWTSYNDRLICVIDNQLVELDIHTGLQQRVSDLELSIVAPPVRNSRFFYIGAADDRLHVFRAKDMVRIFKVAAENDSLVTTILADEEMVVFGTDAGNLIALMADAPRKLWEFKAVEAIAGSIVRDGNSFYFADADTNLYKVDAVEPTKAVLAWRCQMEAILDRSPVVTPGAVYQYAHGRGLTAVDKQSGKALWSLPRGLDLLAESAGKAYVITESNTLAVMDNASGRELYWVNFAAVTNHATNTVDARIYVADPQGRVACLKPIQ
jgi:outer membrane protein assembly factor BamB